MALNPLLSGDHVNQWISTAEQYHYPWDIPGEIIQGAVRELIDLEEAHREAFPSEIEVLIDAENKTVMVRDNGRGFRKFVDLGMHQTGHAVEERIRSGFGIGLSAILARSDYFEINTLIRGELGPERRAISFSDYWENLHLARTKMQTSNEPELDNFLEDVVREPDGIEVGTIITAKGDRGFEALWRAIEDDGAAKFADALFCHTALGFTGNLFHGRGNIPDISYLVTIKTEGNDDEVRQGESLGFLQTEPENGLTFAVHPGRRRDDGEPSRQHFMTYTSIGRATAEDRTTPVIDVFAVCAIGRERGTDDITGEEKLENNFAGTISGGNAISRIFLSIGGFLQPFRIPEPPQQGANLNVNPWYFAIVNVDRNVVEQGRNAVLDWCSPYLSAKIRTMLSKFDSEYRALTRGVDDEDVEVDIRGAIEHARDDPLSAIPITRGEDDGEGRRLYYEPTVLGVPRREAEVIALFVDLCANDIIKQTRILTVGDNVTLYDMLLQFDFPLSIAGQQFVSKIGRQCQASGSPFDRDAPVSDYQQAFQTEFKFGAYDLGRELNQRDTRKNIDQIHLLVAWDLAERRAQGWEVRLCQPHEKIHPQANWIFEKTDNRRKCCHVILLSDLFPDDEIADD